MSTPEHDDGVLAALRQHARLLVGEVAGPLRRIQISRGDAAVEIEWHGDHNHNGGPVRPAAVPPAAPVPATGPADVPQPVADPGSGSAVSPSAVSPGAVSPSAVSHSAASPSAVSHSAVSHSAVSPSAASPSAVSHSIVSPMVGTFYRAPEPGATPFVSVGDLVEPDRVIGIVEAMKLMNEITAGQAGRVLDVLVVDGQPVEFGQALIALAPA